MIAQLNKQVNLLLESPEVRERMAAQGAETLGGTPDDLALYVRTDIVKWGKLIERLGLRID